MLHNSLFLVAHFHNVIIGGVVFGLFAGDRRTGSRRRSASSSTRSGARCSFWFWLAGYWFAFTPLYVLGLMGVTRRMSHFDDPSLQHLVPDRRLRRGADRHRHRARS